MRLRPICIERSLSLKRTIGQTDRPSVEARCVNERHASANHVLLVGQAAVRSRVNFQAKLEPARLMDDLAWAPTTT